MLDKIASGQEKKEGNPNVASHTLYWLKRGMDSFNYDKPEEMLNLLRAVIHNPSEIEYPDAVEGKGLSQEEAQNVLSELRSYVRNAVLQVRENGGEADEASKEIHRFFHQHVEAVEFWYEQQHTNGIKTDYEAVQVREAVKALESVLAIQELLQIDVFSDIPRLIHVRENMQWLQEQVNARAAQAQV